MSRTSILPRTPKAATGQIPAGVESRSGRGSHPIYDHPELAPQGYKESLDKSYNSTESDSIHYAREAINDPINDRIQRCGTRAVRADCQSGHHSFAKVLHCGAEWCPDCGKNDSAVHKQRVARWLPKAQTMSAMGYLVIEWPDAYRDQFLDVQVLRDTRTAIKRYLKRQGYDRGLMRWHYFGDKNVGHYNPHLNILIPVGFMPMPELEALKRGLAKLLGVDMVIVNYQYTNKVNKMMHLLKYVTRATFTNYEWNPKLAAELYRFNTTSSWGNWKALPVMWELHGDDDLGKLAALESHQCPVCGQPIDWCKERRVDKQTGEIMKVKMRLHPVQNLKNEGFTEYAPGWLYWDYNITGEYQLTLDDQDMFDRYCELEQLRNTREYNGDRYEIRDFKARLHVAQQMADSLIALDEYLDGLNHVN